MRQRTHCNNRSHFYVSHLPYIWASGCARDSHDPYVPEMIPEQFPAALHAQVAQALHYYASSRGAASEDVRLMALRKTVCRHAHSTSMTREDMLSAIGCAYEGVLTYSAADVVALRFAHNRLVDSCVKEYAIPTVRAT